MEAVYQWISESLIVKFISYLFSKKVYENSLLYRILKRIFGLAISLFKGSFIALFFQNEPWEKEAWVYSRLYKVLSRLSNFYAALRDLVNSVIQNSFSYRFSKKACLDFASQPFRTFSLVFIPAIFAYYALKYLYFGLLDKEVVLVLLVTAISIPLYFVSLPLSQILKGSYFLKAAFWLAESSDVELLRTEERQPGFKYALFGTLIGALCFAMSALTVVKLVGIIALGFLIYEKPHIGIYIVVLILPLVDTLYSVLLMGLTFVAMLLKIDKGKLGIPNGVVPAFFFLASAAIAAFFSVARNESLKIFPIYVAYLMTFLVFYYFSKDEKVMKIALLFQIISTVGISFYGIYQFFFVRIPTAAAWVDTKLFPKISMRVYATLENPNVLAEYLVFVIPIVIAFILTSKKIERKAVFSGLLGVILTCLIMTMSRGGWLGLALAIVIFAAVAERRLFIVLVLIALISPLFLPSVIIDRIASIGSLQDSSNAYRITIWIATLRMLKDYWLTGLGLGLQAFSRVYRDYMIAGTFALHSHNFYLQMCLELGMLGFISFLWFVIKELKGTDRFLKAKKNSWKALFAVGIVSAMFGHLLHGLFDHVWFSPRIALVFWEMAGILSAIITEAKDEEVCREGGKL
ncbi:MAG: O-antigen ligase family protein [Thermosediminibacteraceae bacterium]|nr:O-antigen ligase family protein [Thermosediminibacteraceae bacterium]